MRWPQGMEPERSVVHARNELIIPTSPERIWRWLCCAARWPEWYSNCGWMRFRHGAGPDLAVGVEFVWKTFGVRVKSRVLIFDPPFELGWSASAFGLVAYHGWELRALSDGQTLVVTEETQHGSLTALGRWHLRRGLLREHQNWLESLSRMAASGDPD